MADVVKNLKRPATLDHLKKKKPLERTIGIVLEDEPIEVTKKARERLTQVEYDLESASDSLSAVAKAKLERAVKEAKTALDKALAAQEEATVYARFRSIGRKAYDDLMDEHPPTDEQKKEAEDADTTALYNEDTFPPALVAAAAIEPKMSFEDAVAIFEDWNVSESMAFFMAAIEVCTARRVADLGND